MTTKKNKKILTTAVAGLATVAGVSAMTTAHADEVSNNGNNVNAVQENPAQKAHEEAVQKEHEAQINDDQAGQALSDAQNKADQANQALTDAQNAQKAQQDKVDTAQSAVNDAQDKVNTAQSAVKDAQKNADNATPENINKAKQAVDDQNTTINNAKQSVANANNAVDDANTTLNNANDAVDDANTNVTNKQDALKRADDNLKNAQDILNNSNSGKAQKAYDDATKVVNDDQADVDSKQTAFDAAQTDANNAKTAKDSAQTAVDNAQSDVNDKTDAATTANINYNNAQTATKNASDAVTNDRTDLQNVTDDLNNLNTITLPAGYVQALKNYEDNPTEANKAAVTEAAKSAQSINVFKNIKSDENVQWTFGPDHPLTDEQETELTEFVIQILNPIRQQFGMTPLTMNKGSLAFAKDISKGYDEDKWNTWNTGWHDSELIHKVASEYGLQHFPAGNRNQMYESLSGTLWNGDPDALKPQTHTVSLNDLKETIYNSIRDMLFVDAGSNWGHAEDLVGLMHQGATTVGMGVMVDSMLQTHFISVSNTQTDPNTTNAVANGKYVQMCGNTIAVPDVLTELTNKKNRLTAQLATDQAALTTKQNDEATAKTAKENAADALATAKSNLTNAQNDLAAKKTAETNANQALTDAHSALTTAQSKLATDETVQQNAANTLAAYHADLATKQKAVNEAQSAVNTATQNLKSAQDDLAAKKQAVTDAQADLDAKKQAVKDAEQTVKDEQAKLPALQQALTDLQNAPQVLANAQTALTSAQDDLNAKQQALTNAQNALRPLILATQAAKTSANNANAALQTAKDNKAQADDELAAAKEAAKTDAERYGQDVEINPIHVTAGVQSLADPVIANPQSAPVSAMFMMLSAGNGVALPYGTTAEWVNYNKALADAQHAGTYYEDILVSFPDGSTTVRQLQLTVDPVQQTPQHGSHISGNQVIDANGHVIPGLTVRNGRIFNAQGEDVTAEVLGENNVATQGHMTREQYRAQQAQKLPQTGDNVQSELVLTVLGVVGAFAGMLGLRKKQD